MKSLKKGDFVFHCEHLIELVAKTSLAYKNHLKKKLDVSITDKYASFISHLAFY